MNRQRALIGLILIAGLTAAAAAQILMGEVVAGDEDFGFYNNAVFTADGLLGLVTDPQNSRVIVFDPYRWTDNIVAYVATGQEPAGIYLAPDGLHACVLNIDSNTVTIIRLADFQTATYTPPVLTDFAYYNNIAFSPTGDYGFVCDARTTVNQIYVFRVTIAPGDLHHATLWANTGTGPARTYVSPDGQRAFVLCNGRNDDDQISVIDLFNEPTFAVQHTFVVVDADFDRTGSDFLCLNNIVFSPDSRWGFVCDPQYNDVVAFEIGNYANQPYLDIPGEATPDASLSRIAITPDGARLVASSIVLNRLYVIDAGSLELLRTITDALGFADFDGYNNIAVLSDNRTGLIHSVGSDELMIFDCLTGGYAFRDTGSAPEDLAVSPDEQFLAGLNVGRALGEDSTSIFCLAPAIIDFPFFRTGTGEFTGYGVSNPVNGSQSLLIYGYDNDGELLVGTNNGAAQLMEPLTQFSFIGDIQLGLPAGTHTGWLRVISNSLTARAFFLNTNLTGDYMDGTIATDGVFEDYTVTHVQEHFDGGVYTVQTELFILNPYDTTIHVELSLRNATGTQIAFMETDLEGRHMLTGTMHDLFFRNESFLDLPDGYLVGTTDDGYGVVGFAMIRHLNAGGGVVTVHSVPLQWDPKVGTLYSAHVASGGEQPAFINPYDTVFHVINTAAETAQVTLAFTDDADAASTTANYALTAGQQLVVPAWQAFSLPDPATRPPYVTGNVKITSDRTGLLGDVVFGDGLNALPAFESCLALETAPARQAVFSHVAHGPVGDGTLMYFNGISVCNFNTYPVDATVWIYGQNGTLTGTHVLHLEADSRYLGLLSNMIPAAWPQLGGYVVLDATGPVVAFELFLDNNSRLLSAVPRN
ncbi:MAG: YncE family protein [Acidobacteria bacterium]|nr:YncE family protein [Acidobacteriota bacterium]